MYVVSFDKKRERADRLRNVKIFNVSVNLDKIEDGEH